MRLLRRRISTWLQDVDEELRLPLRSAFAGKPKSFRPLTVFASYHAVTGQAPTSATIRERRGGARPQHVADRR